MASLLILDGDKSLTVSKYDSILEGISITIDEYEGVGLNVIVNKENLLDLRDWIQSQIDTMPHSSM